MSGIGHLAVGFAAKPAAPEVPLWVLLAACEVNDLLYFVFAGTGIEAKVATTMDFTNGVRYLVPSSNPWSHGMFMSLIWSLLAAGLAYLYYKNRRISAIIGGVVFSHWLLDLIMHSNLPLFFGAAPMVGLGLENSGPGFLFMTVFDLLLFAGGIAIYFRAKKGKGAAEALETRKLP